MKAKNDDKGKIIKQIVCDDFFTEFNFSKYKRHKDGRLECIGSVQFTKGDLIRAFKEYGGSFVQSLGDCLDCADHINTQKIMETFQDYVEEYVFGFIKSDKENVEISKGSVEIKE